MAGLPIPLRHHIHASFKHHQIHSFPIFNAAIKLRFPSSLRSPSPVNALHFLRGSIIYKHITVSSAGKQNSGDCCDVRDETLDVFKRWMKFIRSVFPGGSWWDLSYSNPENGGLSISAKPTTVLKALAEMWALVADEKLVFFAAFGTLIIAAISEISMPGIITACIFSARNGETVVFYRNTQFLLFLCVVSGVCSGLRSGCFGIADVILVKRIRETTFSSIIHQDISFFDRETVGDLTSRISSDCQRLSRTIGHDIHLIMRNILQGTGAFINLMTLSLPLALSSLVICSFLSAIFLIHGRYRRKAAALVQDLTASSNEVAQESFSLMRTIRAYGTEREEFQRFSLQLDRLAFVYSREAIAHGFWIMSFVMLYRLTQVVAILLGGTSMLTGCVSAEQLTKYVLYCEWLIYAAWRLQDNVVSLLQSVGASEKVFQLMHLTASHQFLSKGVKRQNLKGLVEFSDVCFHYSSREMNCHLTGPLTHEEVSVLKNVNFSIHANEVVAIVGSSGSGKSTLINLLLRLYEPTSGEIFIDGVPLRRIDIRWRREKIGHVGQEPQLFLMDVKSNISYGCSTSVIQEEIEYAAKIVRAHEFITALPHGYDTIVDDNLLSGGQKQRIAIARAILRDPILLVLDEATSALDAENEGHVVEILRSLKEDSETETTIIIITHRLSTVKAADQILVMDDGQLIENGSHSELISKNGPYSKLFRLQNDAPSLG